jgi:hypothetical protein
MIEQLRDLLATILPGPISDPADLEHLLAACWHEFQGDDGGMTGDKLLGRMEEVIWEPPILSFTIERHGGTVQGSSRASLQEWTLDLDKKTAWCEERRFRQVRARQPRLDVRALAEEVASLILHHQEDERLQWSEDGRVRVVVGKVLPDGSAVAQTLAGRRKRLLGALRQRLAVEGWQEVGVNVLGRALTSWGLPSFSSGTSCGGTRYGLQGIHRQFVSPGVSRAEDGRARRKKLGKKRLGHNTNEKSGV